MGNRVSAAVSGESAAMAPGAVGGYPLQSYRQAWSNGTPSGAQFARIGAIPAMPSTPRTVKRK